MHFAIMKPLFNTALQAAIMSGKNNANVHCLLNHITKYNKQFCRSWSCSTKTLKIAAKHGDNSTLERLLIAHRNTV